MFEHFPSSIQSIFLGELKNACKALIFRLELIKIEKHDSDESSAEDSCKLMENLYLFAHFSFVFVIIKEFSFIIHLSPFLSHLTVIAHGLTKFRVEGSSYEA